MRITHGLRRNVPSHQISILHATHVPFLVLWWRNSVTFAVVGAEKLETTGLSETLVYFHQTVRRCISEDRNLTSVSHWLQLRNGQTRASDTRVRNLTPSLVEIVAKSTILFSCSTYRVAGAFTKLRKATISVVISARPHAITRLPQESFRWTLIVKRFLKICQANSRFIKNLVRITGTLRENLCTFMINTSLNYS
jgi:hypothetical protein